MHAIETEEGRERAEYEGGTSALVLARWNSWVRLYFPKTGDILWVDLREVGYEVVHPAQ
jgi:hypothetical protein